MNRPVAVNLLSIYSALSNESLKEVVLKFSEKQFSFFKNELNQLSVETLSPITKEIRKLLDDKVYLEEILNGNDEFIQYQLNSIEANEQLKKDNLPF